MIRTPRMIAAFVLSLLVVSARAGDNIKVVKFMGADAPVRLGFTVIPGAEIGRMRDALNPVPFIAPLAELSAIPSVPQMASMEGQIGIPSPGVSLGAGAAHENIREALGGRIDAVEKIAQADPSGLGSAAEFGRLYAGQRGGGSFVSAPKQAESTELRLNGDGVFVVGRADAYDQEATRIVAKRKGQIDYSEATDVMDDAYAEGFARATIMKRASQGSDEIEDSHSAHIPMTLAWIDGIFKKGGKRIAVFTSRVYFHHAKNPQSEIAEGLRRVEHTIKDAAWLFRPNGKAEAKVGELDEVVLGFDTRGYKEIKDFVKTQEAKLNEAFPGRFRFVYLDEVAAVPKTIADMRKAVNELILEHKNDGLLDIIEGVIYSRYTGLLLELKTAEYYFDKGYKILQGGRELFDADGMYITELDVVVRSPQGVSYLIEAKSARVPLTRQDVLDGKILYKLDTYKKNRKRLEQSDILGGPLNVVFSVDVGVPPADVPVDGREEYVKRQRKLMTFLRAQEKELSKKYGFPVSFLFLYSVPGHDPVSPDEVSPPSPSKGSSRVDARRSRTWDDEPEEDWGRGRRRHGRR
ncbi:MAG: hypothetical protein HY077_11295 [Elusimicrobia bacterium]|nr:hypothetical protein [Elusimicrobiota bacterium]